MELTTSLIIIGLALFVILTAAAYTVYLERKLSAFIQQRPGPNRVGPFGLLQPLADVVKLLLKEDIVPTQGDKFVHFISPIISVVIALTAYALVPFAANTYISDVNIGVLYVLALTSIAVYGITLAGWSSNSKYALLGGLRSSAQMISYELAMGLSVVSVIILTNFKMQGMTPAGGVEIETWNLSLRNIVETQGGSWLRWNAIINPIGFLIFVTTAFAETNRTPFDLVEAEQELVGGFHTEYSSMKFATFFLAEYINVIVASMVIATLFLGGYLAPYPIEAWARDSSWWSAEVIGNFQLWQSLWGIAWFGAKVTFFVVVFVWVRWTLPRFKYNQLMDIGWKRLLPLAILNLMVVTTIGYILEYVL